MDTYFHSYNINFEHILNADLQLFKICKHIPYNSINPVNQVAKKKEFFISPKYFDPNFEYNLYDDEYFNNLYEIFNRLKIKRNDVVGKLLFEKKERQINKTLMLQNIGKKQFTAYSKKSYGTPSKNLVERAYKILDAPFAEAKPVRLLKNSQSLAILKSVFSAYNLHWKIKKKSMVADASVKNFDKTLHLKKNKRFSEAFIKRLIVHEIGTHVLRGENGRLQPYLIFATGLPGYLSTEEGLAAYLEEKLNVMKPSVLRNYAGRVIAVNFALKHSFVETFNHLRKYFGKDLAFKLATRVKRGLQDTSCEGAFTRDHVYLKGYYDVKEFAEKHGTIEPLFYGKVGIKHIPKLNRIPGLKEPRFGIDMIRTITMHHFLSLY